MFALEMSYCGPHGIPHSEFLNWSDQDKGKALAWMVEDRQRCDMCGTAQWEWEENRHAYHAREEICPGCERKEYANSDEGGKRHPGKYTVLVPNRKTRPEAVLR